MPDPTTAEVEKPEADTSITEVEMKADDEEVFDKDRAMATISKLREIEKEGKRAAKELTDAQSKLKALEDEKLSDQERQANRLAELEARDTTRDAEVQGMRLKLAVYSRADALGLADADLALAVLDRSKIEYGDDGAPTNLDDVLGVLLEDKPILRKSGTKKRVASNDAGAGNEPGESPSLTAAELEMAKKLDMTPERYAAFRDTSSITEYERLRKAEK